MSSSKRRFIKAIASSILIAVFLFGGSAVGAPLTKVVQAGFLVGSMNGIFVAKELGYFKDEGLDFEFTEIESGALGAGALVSGNAQFVDLGIDDVANLQSQSKDIVLFYNVENGLSMNLVVRNNILKDRGVTANSPLDQKIKALKGLRIGITRPGAVTQLFPSYMMKTIGLDPERDAQFIQIGRGAALYAAIVADKIDAFMLSAPNPEKVVADGVGTIIIRPAKDVDIFKEFMFTNIAVRRDWAEKNRSLVEAYCKAVDRANKFIMENRTKAAEILNKTWYKETPVQILDLTLDGFGSNTDGDMSEQGVKNQLGVYGELGVIEGKFDTSEGVLWTNKYNPHSFPKK
jgi:ABC-type nitrate/sulfonate/bicarbonate transport system substrate-binding protein